MSPLKQYNDTDLSPKWLHSLNAEFQRVNDGLNCRHAVAATQKHKLGYVARFWTYVTYVNISPIFKILSRF